MLSRLVRQKQYMSDSTRPDIVAIRPTRAEIQSVYTAVDSTPYMGMFQGKISPQPHVFDRRAGWAPQYAQYLPAEPDHLPEHCFEAPCNTVYTRLKKDGVCVIDECVNTYR